MQAGQHRVDLCNYRMNEPETIQCRVLCPLQTAAGFKTSANPTWRSADISKVNISLLKYLDTAVLLPYNTSLHNFNPNNRTNSQSLDTPQYRIRTQHNTVKQAVTHTLPTRCIRQLTQYHAHIASLQHSHRSLLRNPRVRYSCHRTGGTKCCSVA